ncbi:MAG: 2-oxo acid dehydrogenase subunit E2 [Bifidobacteriaceae bacterium]|jgi:pyruvate dehydrogenase E2 component (dihydrolipoamide acetyltransferase)|nr:2-oxo acid dehydrogenase subunit E2 [Bifidobacteriaceae bacterium]
MPNELLTFKLPDPGEGLTEAEIIRWLVAPGDSVSVNQPVVEIETAKSVVELPSPFDGIVAALAAGEGAVVPVGRVILKIAPRGADTATLTAPPTTLPATLPDAVTSVPPARPDPAAAPPPGPVPVRVGYGPGHTPAAAWRGADRAPGEPGDPAELVGSAAPDDPGPGSTQAAPGALSLGGAPGAPGGPGSGSTQAAPGALSLGRVRAKPPVRALARQLGVDLGSLVPSGDGGVVTRADVEEAASCKGNAAALGAAGGTETREPIRSVRRATAQAMVASAFTAPHATLFHEVDVTRGLNFAKRAGVGFLALAELALVRAARRHRVINARWDEAAGEIVYRSDVALGIAVDTDRGLVVPVLHGAEGLGLAGLAAGTKELVAKARAGQLSPGDTAGGTVSLTNVGVFRIDTGTPILVPGQAAILALGAARMRPWVHRGKLKIRQVACLSLAIDHRLVDGADGARALRDIADVLENPAAALL